MNNKYSVLMSVYYKEKSEFLSLAMASMWNQTVKPDEFVLVCDGPLDSSLDAVISDMLKTHPELKVIRLEKNVGLGKALNEGIKHCNNELIARMDSDDISRPNRCECQLKLFNNINNLSIVSGTVEEFSESIDKIEARRVLPKRQDEILQFAKKRNPFNHPCVMYKKSHVEAAGGYQDFFLLEDYYLWIRMLRKGFLGYNLQKPLLWMRAGSEMYKRRSGWKYVKSQKALFRYMRDVGFITWFEYVKNVCIRTVSSLTPNWFRTVVFKSIIRK